MTQRKTHRYAWLAVCIAISACTATPAPKPLDPQASSQQLLAKSPNSPAFQQYLVRYGYTQEALPLKAWEIDALTLSALYHHTQMQVARQQLMLAQLATKTAQQRPIPTIHADIAHSNQRNDDIKPWAYGLSIDIPLSTNNKRHLYIEQSQQQLEIARLDVAETAWHLRSEIAADLMAYHQNNAEIQLLQTSFATHEAITHMLKKRVDAGVASRTALNNAQLLALEAKHQLRHKQAEATSIQAKLAADVGLTPDQFASISIAPLAIEETIAKQATLLAERPLQQDALLNRIDIRRGLLQYAVAETKLKLQAAKQIPDMTISPGILFEFGDTIWSLGFSSLLNLFQQNTALLDEAKQLRAIEGAQFEHLQAQVIAQTSQADAQYTAAKQTLAQAEQALSKQIAQEEKMQKQFDAGLIGRLDLAQYARNTVIAKQQKLTAQFALLKAANDIENIMQKPIYSTFKLPALTESEAQP